MIVTKAFRKENEIQKSWFGCIYHQLIWCFSFAIFFTPAHCSISYRTACSLPQPWSQPDSPWIQLTSVAKSRGLTWHEGTTMHKGPERGTQTCWTRLHRTRPCCEHCSSATLLSREERHGALGVIKAHLLLTLHQLEFWGAGNIPYSSFLLLQL